MKIIIIAERTRSDRGPVSLREIIETGRKVANLRAQSFPETSPST